MARLYTGAKVPDGFDLDLNHGDQIDSALKDSGPISDEEVQAEVARLEAERDAQVAERAEQKRAEREVNDAYEFNSAAKEGGQPQGSWAVPEAPAPWEASNVPLELTDPEADPFLVTPEGFGKVIPAKKMGWETESMPTAIKRHRPSLVGALGGSETERRTTFGPAGRWVFQGLVREGLLTLQGAAHSLSIVAADTMQIMEGIVGDMQREFPMRPPTEGDAKGGPTPPAAQWWGGGVAGEETPFARMFRGVAEAIGKPELSDTVVGGVLRMFGQLSTVMVPVMGWMKRIKFISGLLSAGKVSKTVAGEGIRGLVAGFVADFVALDPTEPNVSNFIQSVTKLDPGIAKTIVDYLAAPIGSDAEELRADTTLKGVKARFEARLKQGIEGAIVGVPLGVVVDTSLAAIRSLRVGMQLRHKAALFMPGGMAVHMDDRKIMDATIAGHGTVTDIPSGITFISTGGLIVDNTAGVTRITEPWGFRSGVGKGPVLTGSLASAAFAESTGAIRVKRVSGVKDAVPILNIDFYSPPTTAQERVLAGLVEKGHKLNIIIGDPKARGQRLPGGMVSSADQLAASMSNARKNVATAPDTMRDAPGIPRDRVYGDTLTFDSAGAHALLVANRGFTWNVLAGDMGRYDPDLHVGSLFPELQETFDGAVSHADLVAYYEKVKHLVPLDNENVHLGGRYEEKTRTTYLNVVVTVPREKQILMEALGRQHNQKSITKSLTPFEDVSTGGRGTAVQPEGKIDNILPSFRERLKYAGVEPDVDYKGHPAVSISSTSQANQVDHFNATIRFKQNKGTGPYHPEGPDTDVTSKGKNAGALKGKSAMYVNNVAAALIARSKSGAMPIDKFGKKLESALKVKTKSNLTLPSLKEEYALSTQFIAEAYEGGQVIYTRELKKAAGEFKDPTTGKPTRAFPETHELNKLLEAGMFRLNWYDRAFDELIQFFDGDAVMAAKLLAAASPQVPVERSIEIMTRAYRAMKISPNVDAFLQRVALDPDLFTAYRNDNLVRIYQGMDLQGSKVVAFFKNIIGDKDAVTVDTWMRKIFFFKGDGAKGASAGEIAFITEHVRQLADDYNISPREAQAAMWVGKQIADGKDWDFAKVLAAGTDDVDPKLTKAFESFDVILRRKIDEAVGSGVLKFPANESILSAGFIPLPDMVRFGAGWIFARAAAGALYGGWTANENASPEARFQRALLYALGGVAIGMVRPKGFMNVIDLISRRGAKLVKEQQRYTPPPEVVARPDMSDPTAAKATADAEAGVPPRDSEVSTPDRRPRLEPDTTEKIGIEYERLVDLQRRGVRADVDVEAEADQLAAVLTIEDVRKILPGTTMSDSQALALGMVLGKASDKLLALAVHAKAAKYDLESTTAFIQQLAVFMDIDPKFLGVAAEAGRTERILGHEAYASRSKLIRDLENTVRDQRGGASTSRMIDKIAKLESVDKVAVFARNLVKPGYFDMFIEMWVMGLLSSIRSTTRNLGSNAAVFFWQAGVRGTGRLFREGLEGGIAKGEALAALRGAFEGIGDAWRLLREGLRYEAGDPRGLHNAGGEGFMSSTKFDIRPKAITSENLQNLGGFGAFLDRMGSYFGLGGDNVGKVIRHPGRWLVAGDEFFRSINFDFAVAAAGHREGYATATAEGLTGRAFADRADEIKRGIRNDIPPSIRKDAEDFATYQVFQTALGPAGKGFQALMANPVGRIIMPFQRTPINVLKYAGEHTPAASLSPAVRKELLSDDPARRQIALGKMYMGSMTMGFIGVLAGMGYITTSGPRDHRLRNQKKQLGWEPTSFILDINRDGVKGGPGDIYVNLTAFEPIGTLIILAADVGHAIANLDFNDLRVSKLAEALTFAAVAAFNSRQFVMGLSQLLGVIGGSERDAWSFIRNFARGSLPYSAALRDLSRYLDPHYRVVRTLLDSVFATFPGYSLTLPTHRNLWAEPVERPHLLGPDFVSVITISVGKKDAVFSEFDRLKYSPPRRRDKIQGVALTAEQQDRLVVLMGKEIVLGGRTLKENLKQLIFKDLSYRNAPDEVRKSFISQDILAYRKAAERRLQIEYQKTLGVSISNLQDEEDAASRKKGAQPVGIGVLP